MRSLSGQLLPVINYAGPLACGDCGGPANQPAHGVARAEQRGNWGWRVCSTCDRDRSAWSRRRINPLAALVGMLYDPVAALAVREYGPDPYRVLAPYANLSGVEPTDDPGERWEHISRDLLEMIVDRSVAARWSQVVGRAPS
ncbi:hypothetical protein [Streptomyces violaceusniger]|uniref:Uncharacterized protein n=1 Tax=Streptomyces violaceusniger (strain Tu 4113) TaxID=653045 RepID=G2PHD8_STRV4|nr:hypothetical protein [Streptomyces violaceusniger]AEM88784.1 hypothetical protein Strvi_0007 [Streptomyces violaceusniger Tu 4113]